MTSFMMVCCLRNKREEPERKGKKSKKGDVANTLVGEILGEGTKYILRSDLMFRHPDAA